MEENASKEHIENPADSPPEIPTNQEEINESSTENEPALPQQPSANMEVHQHAHHDHGKRNWKSYFWEFLMLFLAVFCGFLAEYKLEQTIERHREKEFILSMIEDAATDTAAIHGAIAQNTLRIAEAEKLCNASLNYSGSQAEDTRIYWSCRKTIYYPELMYPADRTLFQLKNAGGMRLIKNKQAAESIIQYDNSGKRVLNQQAYYEHYLTELTKASSRIMNFEVLLTYKNKSASKSYDTARLVNPTTDKLLDLGNNAKMFQGVMRMYIIRLQEMEKESLQLMDKLRKEYEIE
jgi:hypothetical protein